MALVYKLCLLCPVKCWLHAENASPYVHGWWMAAQGIKVTCVIVHIQHERERPCESFSAEL